MGKNKIGRFIENKSFSCLVQPEFSEIFDRDHPLKGRWNKDFFKNDRPIVLELGCGRGEYTVGLSKLCPDKNFIGIDVKGARMWRGAKTVTEEQLPNAGFLRTRIEFIRSFFAEGEIDEIWITFPDPQLKKSRVKKRLTGAVFLMMYSGFLRSGGVINLKTDSLHLHRYTKALIDENRLTTLACCEDIYSAKNFGRMLPEVISIKTTYENRYVSENKPITFLKFTLDHHSLKEPYFAPDALL